MNLGLIVLYYFNQHCVLSRYNLENEEGRTSLFVPPKSCHVSLTNNNHDVRLSNNGFFLNTPRSQLTQGQNLWLHCLL